MNIKRIILESEDEDNSTMKNKLMRYKKKRIIEVESSSDEDIITKNFNSAKIKKNMKRK